MFSEELKQKLIAYFFEKYGIHVTKEKAEEYLNSIAEFYLVLATDNKSE